MNKTVKIISILMLVLMVVSFSTIKVYAANTAAGVNILDPDELVYEDTDMDDDFTKTAGKIMTTIRNIAAIAAVIIIMVLGVKYMLGSIEEKAEYKKSFMPLIIGVVLVVAATTIASFLFNIV